jgi:hypothetical protein
MEASIKSLNTGQIDTKVFHQKSEKVAVLHHYFACHKSDPDQDVSFFHKVA